MTAPEGLENPRLRQLANEFVRVLQREREEAAQVLELSDDATFRQQIASVAPGLGPWIEGRTREEAEAALQDVATGIAVASVVMRALGEQS